MVSAKILTELKKKLDAAEVNVSETIREALRDEIRRQHRTDLQERAAPVQAW